MIYKNNYYLSRLYRVGGEDGGFGSKRNSRVKRVGPKSLLIIPEIGPHRRITGSDCDRARRVDGTGVALQLLPV